MQSFKLPSGATLQVSDAPFEVSKNLYQVIFKELKSIDLNIEVDMLKLSKEIFCSLLASKRVELAVWKCMERSIYNKAKITKETFEPVEARQDYIEVLWYVTKVNVEPFTKSLYARFRELTQGITNSQA